MGGGSVAGGCWVCVFVVLVVVVFVACLVFVWCGVFFVWFSRAGCAVDIRETWLRGCSGSADNRVAVVPCCVLAIDVVGRGTSDDGVCCLFVSVALMCRLSGVCVAW